MTNYFTSIPRTHYSCLVRLGVPIVVGQLGTVVLGFADTLMIGHHSMQELAAASFINVMFTLVVIFSMGFSYGLTPVVGNHYGRDEHEAIGDVLRNSMAANTALCALMLMVCTAFYMGLDYMGQPTELLPLMHPYLLVNILSLPFMCWFNCFKQFFDGITHTRAPMYVILGGNVLNIVGNAVLIYGLGPFPEMGLLGAGISTLFSRVMMCVAFAVIFFSLRKYRVYRDACLKGSVKREMFVRLNALGWPVALQLGMETASFSLAALFVGWIGTTALAAHQVSITVSQVLYLFHRGMA